MTSPHPTKTYASDTFHFLTGRDETPLTGRDGEPLISSLVATSWRRQNTGVSATPFVERAPQEASEWQRHSNVVDVPPTPFMDERGI